MRRTVACFSGCACQRASGGTVAPLARAHGVGYTPGTRSFPEPADGDGYIRLNFAAVPLEAIEEGMRRSAAPWTLKEGVSVAAPAGSVARSHRRTRNAYAMARPRSGREGSQAKRLTRTDVKDCY